MTRVPFLAAVLGLAFVAGPARAELVLMVSSPTVPAGTVGLLDVTLTNSDLLSPAVTVAGFGFTLTLPAGVGVTFTAADPAAGPAGYIFAGNSLAAQFPPFAVTPLPDTTVSVADVFAVPNAGVPVAGGETVGLGRFTFAVSPAAAGDVPVLIEGFGGTLVRPDGTPFSPEAIGFADGTITVRAATSPVPEPSALAVLAVLGLAAAVRGRGGRAPTGPTG